ncbi:hypothetical protein F5Y06DRAFT_267154 [Hypoxylon sp. FL0890]|nr:hypothetical protein F5Y06DRAFT_267154 [Hypoxylon sp. FL0890]
MPRSATSPSNFIYQKAQGSSVASFMSDDRIMELTDPNALGICRPRESLAINHAPWEAVDHGLREPTQTNRRATFPTTLIPNVCQKGSQPRDLYEKYSPTHCPCFFCHYQIETLDGLPPEALGRDFYSEPTYHPPYLPAATVGPQCVSSTASDGSPQQYFPTPLLQDITSPRDQCSPVALPGIGSPTLSFRSSTPERTQRISATVRAVHDICLQSTKTFLDSHLANRRARASNSADGMRISHKQSKSGTSKNTTSNDNINISIDNTKTTHSPIPESSNSLLNNISSICTMLWAGSQRERLDVLNVERAAVENMGRILCWAETVALGDYDEWTMADEEALRQVLEAGRSLCYWLQVPDGIQGVDALESDVMGPGFGVF